MIWYIHFADVDRAVDILNNILIQMPNQEEQDNEDNNEVDNLDDG